MKIAISPHVHARARGHDHELVAHCQVQRPNGRDLTHARTPGGVSVERQGENERTRDTKSRSSSTIIPAQNSDHKQKTSSTVERRDRKKKCNNENSTYSRDTSRFTNDLRKFTKQSEQVMIKTYETGRVHATNETTKAFTQRLNTSYRGKLKL